MRIYLPWLMAAMLLTALPRARAVDATFVQLNRDAALRTVEDWEGLFGRMKEAGLDTVIVQWCAEPPLVYFEMEEAEELSYFEEVYDVVGRLLDAAGRSGMSVYLGLQNNPHFWTQINGREKVIRDFFLLRVARNERLQLALLKQFNEHPAWIGYYLPDEVDDLTWRKEPKQSLVRDYFKLMTRRIRVNDAVRPVAASAFFRGRTAPDLVADNLLDIFAGSSLDYLLVQDGVGTGDPPISYVSLYYEVLVKRWSAHQQAVMDERAAFQAGPAGARVAPAEPQDPPGEPVPLGKPTEANAPGAETAPAEGGPVEPPPLPPVLWGVVETFEQLSGENEAFRAQPATPARLRKQLDLASPFFQRLVLFTFADYMDPARGKAEQALFKVLAPGPSQE